MRVLLIALLAAISYAQTDFLTLEAYITNDEAGFSSTCQSVATAFKGELLECNLEKIAERRTLEEGESIFLDVLVPDANMVIDALESDSYSIPNVLGLRMPKYGSIRRYLDSPYIGDDVAGGCLNWCDSGRPSSTYCDWPNCGKCPACYPTRAPTVGPTSDPSTHPTKNPTNVPTINPTRNPTNIPTKNPTNMPSVNPTKAPTANPTINPTNPPTANPTMYPTESPEVPSKSPTDNPSTDPTLGPTDAPSIHPTYMPTGHPTVEPTSGRCDAWCPGKKGKNSWYDACGRTGSGFWRCSGCTECGQLTDEPSAEPTLFPTNHPSDSPTEPQPTNVPTIDPTMNPTRQCSCQWWCHNWESRNRVSRPWSTRCQWTRCCGCSSCFPCSSHSECTHEDDLNRNFCKRRSGKGYCTTCDECEECGDGIDDTCGPSCGTTKKGKTCN